jgi:hypothetical protein
VMRSNSPMRPGEISAGDEDILQHAGGLHG